MNKNTKRRKLENKVQGGKTHGVMSVSGNKNIQMVVAHNVGPDGRKDSITRFIPVDTSRNSYRRFSHGS